ncbi:hypothetical protein ACU686_32760 [Yinghuangia aomiensis]
MNAVGGFASATRRRVGAARPRRVEASPRPAEAALGLGRTFQAATLFPELTVRETRADRLGSPRPHWAAVVGIAAAQVA